MGLVVRTSPNEEPLALPDAKAHLRVTFSDDDTYIATLITVALEAVERETGRQLILSDWTLALDSFPNLIRMPKPPLVDVDEIRYIDVDGNSQVLAATKYSVDAKSTPGRIQPAFAESWPSTREVFNAVEIDFSAGYANAASVPTPIKQAMLLTIGHLYSNRESVVIGQGLTAIRLPDAVDALLSPFKVIRDDIHA